MSTQHDGDENQSPGERDAAGSGRGHDTVTIHIDRKKYDVESTEVTGSELRQVAQPPIGANYDLWREIPGGEDELIEDGNKVTLGNGMHFFSTEKHITPGV
jgi:hypothetical protein